MKIQSLLPDRSGFTLIELSIVLVIIGLIVGGILVGRDLIHQAEIRSILTQVDSLEAAVNTFRLKYNCIPGDCANATDYFTAGPSCASGLSGPGELTCNGNGNGQVNFETTPVSMNEKPLLWQHLSLAKLIPGSFTGPAGVYGSWVCNPGVNCPATRLGNTTLLVGYMEWTDPLGLDWLMTGNLMFVAEPSTPPNRPTNSFLSAGDAFVLDQKADDGNPGTGKWTSAAWGIGGTELCQVDASGNPITNANTPAFYNTHLGEQKACAFNVRMGF